MSQSLPCVLVFCLCFFFGHEIGSPLLFWVHFCLDILLGDSAMGPSGFIYRYTQGAMRFFLIFFFGLNLNS